MTHQLKPIIDPPNLDGIPAELRELSRWVYWRLESLNNKWAKIPYGSGTGSPQKAKSSQPATWMPYSDAVERYRQHEFDGIGFEFHSDGPYFGIDLDDCRDPSTGDILPNAMGVIQEFGTYAEVSPSKTGVKLIGKGRLNLPGGKTGKRREAKWTPDITGAVECYDRGRYFALTGNVLPGYDAIVDCGETLQTWFAAVFHEPETVKKVADSAPAASEQRDYRRDPPTHQLPTYQLAIPEFIEPAYPDMQPALAIHRGHDGFVSFHRHDKGEFQDLFSIKARDLEGVFPQLVPKLETDSYFSVNGFWRPGYGVSRNAPQGTTLRRAHRSSTDLRWLTCCFADLDCHSLGVSLGTAIGAVIDAQDKKEIPPASMLTRSGRGLWAFWFLASDDGSSLVRYFPEKVQLWAAIQNSIGERFAAIGADAGARDVSRVTRIAGSVNSKTAAGSRVAYWIQANPLGQRYTYRLGDLANCFNVELPKPNRLISAKNAELQARGRKGSAGRWRHDLARFNALSELRKTWPVGVRNNAVLVLATILKSLKRADGQPEFPPGVVREEIHKLWERMEQPSGNRFDWQAALATVNVSESRPVKHQTIADMLRVTPEEAELIGGWPAALAFGKKSEVAQLSRTATCLRRREAIRDIVGELGGHCPPYRDLAKRVEERCGIPAPMSVVMADCKEMGIKNPRSRRKSRKRAQSKQRNLFSE